MKNVIFYFIIFLIATPAIADGRPAYACLLKKPFVFGASVSAGYGRPRDGALAHILGLKTIRGSQPSPIEQMSYGLFREEAEIINKAEMINTMPFESIGAKQFFYYFETEESPYQLNDFTLIAGIDAFYWPASYGRHSYSSCVNYLASMGVLFERITRDKTPAIFGTVPVEKQKHIAPKLKKHFSKDTKECAESINYSLSLHCKIENNCFLVPVHKWVKQLRSKNGIVFESVRYKAIDYDKIYNESRSPEEAKKAIAQIPKLRFDGIHLSDAGIRYAATLIHRELLKGKNLCPR